MENKVFLCSSIIERKNKIESVFGVPLRPLVSIPGRGSLVWWPSMPCAARTPRASTHQPGNFAQALFSCYSLLPGYCQPMPAHRSRNLPTPWLWVVFVLKCLQPLMKGGLRRPPRQKAACCSYHLRSPGNVLLSEAVLLQHGAFLLLLLRSVIAFSPERWQDSESRDTAGALK